MANNTNNSHTDAFAEQRINNLEQMMVRMAEQVQILAQGINFLKEAQPKEGPSGTKEDGQPVDDEEIQYLQTKNSGPTEADLRKEFEAQAKEVEKKILQQFQAKLKALENLDGYDQAAMVSLPAFEEGTFPEKFKVPDFEKYDGTGCPKLHATLYIRKMGQYVKYDRFMVQTFQDSLTGPALTWYAQLDLTEIDTWDKLARAFYNQYKFNTEVAPSIWDLSNLQKKKGESFKEYAQRWRALAAKVTTPIPEKDLVFTFINTLEDPFFSHLIGHASASFAEIVVSGSHIENAIKSGKILAHGKKHMDPISSKEASINMVNLGSHDKPTLPTTLQVNQHLAFPSTQINRSLKRKFTHIPISLSQAFHQLKGTNVITCETPKPGYRPWNADANSQCDYHMGQKGHSTDTCWRLKNKIQELIDVGLIQFDELPITGNNSP